MNLKGHEHRRKAEALQLLIDRIDYDGKVGQVTIHFHPMDSNPVDRNVTENAA